jgi:hypothetical protein
MAGNFGNFNFGEPMPEKHKPRIAQWQSKAIVRNETPLFSHDIPIIAKMFFIDEATIEEICDKLGGTEVAIRTIITGGNFAKDWTRAVVNLIADGHDCSRPITGFKMRNDHVRYDPAARKGAPRGKMPVEAVLLSRQMHMDGNTLAEIVEEVGYKHTAIRAIIRNETYRGDEYIPEGWVTDG